MDDVSDSNQPSRKPAAVFVALLLLLLLPMAAPREQDQPWACLGQGEAAGEAVGWPRPVMSVAAVRCGDPAQQRTWHWFYLVAHLGGALTIASLVAGVAAERGRWDGRPALAGAIILLGLGGLTVFAAGLADTLDCDAGGACALPLLLVSTPGLALAAGALGLALAFGRALSRPVRLLGLACAPLAVCGYALYWMQP